MEQDGTTKAAGTDQLDRGDLSVIAITGDGMSLTLPVNSLRASQQSRKVVAAAGATVTLAFSGSKALEVLEEVVGARKGTGRTRIRLALVSGRKKISGST